MFEKDDLPFIHTLRKDEDSFSLTLGLKQYPNLMNSEAWLEQKMRTNTDYKYFVICLKENEQPIGFLSANNIDLINRKAEWGGIVLLPQYTSKGIGKLAGELLMDYLYGELGIHLIYGFVNVENFGSFKMAEKLGFKRTGQIPEFIYKNYTYQNVYIYALTRIEYLEHKLHSKKVAEIL